MDGIVLNHVDSWWELAAIVLLVIGWVLRESIAYWKANKPTTPTSNGNGSEKIRKIALDVCAGVVAEHEVNCHQAGQMTQAVNDLRSEVQEVNKNVNKIWQFLAEKFSAMERR